MPHPQKKTDDILDVLIIGAGISGIGTACHLERECPGQTYAILDRRDDVGGTWDLFRYPGIRSDSDVFTFGFQFKPWTRTKILADGESIKEYIRESAQEYGVDKHIRFGLKVSQANWSSEESCWQVTAANTRTGKLERYRGRFLIMGTGYYNYDQGYEPEFPGIENFGGQVVHPQKWPEDLDYDGKKVVIIGSGATAVTLVPSMAGKAEHVTMLQRSPSYIFSVPQYDRISENLKRFMSEEKVYELARKRQIAIFRGMWNMSKKFPSVMRKILLSAVEKQVGKDQMHHFTPDYKPWDQRLCAVPGNDLFKAMREGEASVVTDHIERFDKTGIQLKSGEHIDADIVITATGLELQMLGGTELSVDGETKDLSNMMMYKAVMLQGVPNFSWIMGYVNYPWTLKADIVAGYMCRLINHMNKKGYKMAVPVDDEGCITDTPFLDKLDSGYMKRAEHKMPRQGDGGPWAVTSNYVSDKKILLENPIEDGVLQFDVDLSSADDGPEPMKIAV